MAEVVGKIIKNESSQKFSDVLESLLAVLAFVSFLGAILFAYLWLATSLYTPYENYNETSFFKDINGNSFRIEYPKRILANDKQAVLTITLRGEIDATKTVYIEVPNEVRPLQLSDSIELPGNVRLLKYKNSAANRVVDLNFVIIESDIPQTVKLTFVNSKTVKGFGWYRNKKVIINSSDLLSNDISIDLQMETVGGAAIREFVNSSVGEKSPFILLVSSLITGVGTLWLQLNKDRRDLQKDIEQSQKEKDEDNKKYEERLLNAFLNEPVRVIREFVIDCKNGESENFESIFAKLEVAGFPRVLIEKILILWQNERFNEIKFLIDDILYLQGKFTTNLYSFEIKILNQLQGIAVLKDYSGVKKEDIETILDAFELWGGTIRPILIPIVSKVIGVPTNLVLLQNVFEKKGSLLLWDRKIQEKLMWYREAPERLLIPQEADSLRNEEKKQIINDRLKILLDFQIGSLASSHVIWRPLWKHKVTKYSVRLYNWLKSHNFQTKNFFFGEELAELDGKLFTCKKYHPIFEKIDQLEPLLLFGNEGMGKTSAAYHLVDSCRNPKPDKYSGAFPIYATYHGELNIKEWILISVARSLVDFISNNPRHFISASSAQRVAMGNLMLSYGGSIDNIEIAFARSESSSNEDLHQVIAQLTDLGAMPKKKILTDVDLIDLLYMAKPDGYNCIFFIIDISGLSTSRPLPGKIKELENLIIPLIQADFFIKAFLPMELKSSFDKQLIEVLSVELTWDEEMLSEMLKLRFERFPSLCDMKRTIKDPFEIIASASSLTPRKAIRFGNALMNYAEENLSDYQKLDSKIFGLVRKKLIERGSLFNS